MTQIEIFAGLYGENGDWIGLPGAELVNDKVFTLPYAKAIAAAHVTIAERKLRNVCIIARGTVVWADPEATADLYPLTGKPPASRRSGATAGNISAESAVRCPWDKTRYKMIPYA